MIVRILSWFTYAGGGFDRSVPGTALGVLGKGTVARGRCDGFLTGLTLGFSLGTVVSLFL